MPHKKSSAKIQIQNLGQHAVKVNLGFLNFFHCKEAQQGVFLVHRKSCLELELELL